MYVIENDVPLPTPNKKPHGDVRETLEHLYVGQSFTVPAGDDPTATARRINSRIQDTRRKRTDLKFSARLRDENGQRVVRVWRVA